ncbi:globin [Luminiphilus syltensis NOR5-1B]|uniref:Globin n=1 Tax=Luminiphilus syltensis NOR5-1B TaxID=565045 RepID=B8KSF2_9GAMM|nr:group II truncated hemoglobin [Luminiphilus syltensis]EED35184.1 globin [Luminiphilus syltensis NOR5-1B]
MSDVPNTPYEILGDDGIRALADAFYDAMESLPEAEGIRAMHGDDLTKIRSKFCAYLTGWLGGPPVYHQITGTVCLTEPHAAYRIGPDERDQWLLCMEKALDTIKASDVLREMLKDPLYRIAEAVRNRDSSELPTSDPNVIAAG